MQTFNWTIRDAAKWMTTETLYNTVRANEAAAIEGDSDAQRAVDACCAELGRRGEG